MALRVPLGWGAALRSTAEWDDEVAGIARTLARARRALYLIAALVCMWLIQRWRLASR